MIPVDGRPEATRSVIPSQVTSTSLLVFPQPEHVINASPKEAIRNKCTATSNKCLTRSNKKLVRKPF